LFLFAVLGPYTLEYTSNGRYMIVGGRKGHIAMMDMLNRDLIKEFEVSFFLAVSGQLLVYKKFPSMRIYLLYSMFSDPNLSQNLT
jgi:hypothetical protein